MEASGYIHKGLIYANRFYFRGEPFQDLEYFMCKLDIFRHIRREENAVRTFFISN